MSYQDLVPVGTVLIIASTSFGLGFIYSNLPYDLKTLWKTDETGEFFEKSLAHYSTWATTSPFVYHIFHAVIALGFMGCFIKLFKPHPDATYFEYGTLALYLFSVIIYLTNLRIGMTSCLTGEWGDVDAKTGINVMAASQVIIVMLLFGVLMLQGGLYFAQWYDEKLKREFFAKHDALTNEVKKENITGGATTEVTSAEVATSKSTGSSAPATKAKKRTK